MGIPKEGVVTPDIGTGIHDILKFQPDFHDFFVGYIFFQCMYVYIHTCSMHLFSISINYAGSKARCPTFRLASQQATNSPSAPC